MDKAKLGVILKGLHIPEDSYSIDKIKDESLCLVFDGGSWNIFYSERGSRTDVQSFTNEEEACEAFLTRIKKWF